MCASAARSSASVAAAHREGAPAVLLPVHALKALAEAGTKHHIHSTPGEHAFMRDEGPRYDNLVETLGGKPTPGVGFGAGALSAWAFGAALDFAHAGVAPAAAAATAWASVGVGSASGSRFGLRPSTGVVARNIDRGTVLATEVEVGAITPAASAAQCNTRFSGC